MTATTATTATSSAAPAPSVAQARAATPHRNKAYEVLIGLTGLLIVLQGLWAGIFLEHDGRRDSASSWIDVHARGADVSIILAAVATIIAWVKLRERKELWIGTAVLTLVLLFEAYIGGLIRDEGKDTLTAVHVPLAMLLVGLAVWLPLRAVRGSRA